MSKSKGNVVNPDAYIEKFGADTLRTYLMFCGRFDQGGDFRDTGIEGMTRYLRRVWKLANRFLISSDRTDALPLDHLLDRDQKSVDDLHVARGNQNSEIVSSQVTSSRTKDRKESDVVELMHRTIKKVTEDIEGLNFNTAIAALMEWLNALEKQPSVSAEEIQNYLLLLAPFAPYMTEELWQKFFGRGPVRTFLPTNAHSRQKSDQKQKKDVELRVGGSPPSSVTPLFRSIHLHHWPKFDAKLAQGETVDLVIQVNGKLRDKLTVERGIKQEKAEELARASQNVAKYLEKTRARVVFVPDRLINFVTG